MGLNGTLKGLPQGLINDFVGVSSPRLGLSPFNFLILFTRKGGGGFSFKVPDQQM